jgi:hypothetical protein
MCHVLCCGCFLFLGSLGFHTDTLYVMGWRSWEFKEYGTWPRCIWLGIGMRAFGFWLDLALRGEWQ